MICDIHLQVPLIEIYWNPSFTGRFVTTSPEVSGTVRAKKNRRGIPTVILKLCVIPDSTTDSPSKHDNTGVCFKRGQPITHTFVTGGACIQSYLPKTRFSNVRLMSHLGQCHSNDLPFAFRISVGTLWLLVFAWCKNNSIYRIRTPQHLCGILVYLSVKKLLPNKNEETTRCCFGSRVRDGSVSFLNILPVTSTKCRSVKSFLGLRPTTKSTPTKFNSKRPWKRVVERRSLSYCVLVTFQVRNIKLGEDKGHVSLVRAVQSPNFQLHRSKVIESLLMAA